MDEFHTCVAVGLYLQNEKGHCLSCPAHCWANKYVLPLKSVGSQLLALLFYGIEPNDKYIYYQK